MSRITKPTILTLVVTLMMATITMIATPAQAGTQGCTPGYWKQSQHFKSWTRAGYSTGTKLSTVLVATPSTLASKTMLQGLSLQGGSGVSGAQEILLRASVAALLNAGVEATTGRSTLNYPYTKDVIQTWVNNALTSGDRTKMLDVAKTLDSANNLGCPLN